MNDAWTLGDEANERGRESDERLVRTRCDSRSDRTAWAAPVRLTNDGEFCWKATVYEVCQYKAMQDSEGYECMSESSNNHEDGKIRLLGD